MASTDETLTLAVPPGLRALWDRKLPERMADRVFVLASPDRRGLWCTTKGLGEFGLPELQAIDVPPRIGVAWAGVLTGIALRLLERWIVAVRDENAAFVELPASIELTRSDIARAYGEGHDAVSRSATVQLRLDPAPDLTSDSFLTVGPPKAAQGSAADYLTRVCAELFGAPTVGAGD